MVTVPAPLTASRIPAAPGAARGSGRRPARWRVTLVVNSLARGGAETQLVRLAARLVSCGHAVHVVTLLPDDELAGELRSLAVPVVSLSAGGRVRGPALVLGLARELRRWRPDVAVSFLYQSNVATRLAARAVGVRAVVSSVRNEHFGGRARVLAMRSTDRLATLTTTNSALVAASLVRRRVVPRSRLVVIPNALPDSAFAPATNTDRLRAELGVGPDDFCWIGVGRLVPQKAWPDLLVAFAATEPAALNSRLLIAGDGPQATDLARLAARLGVGDRVLLLGPRTDVRRLLAVSDALVLSSVYEGLPNVVLEAMAAGLPVVATEVGGVPELVTEEVGITVPPGNPGELAEAMRRMTTARRDVRAAMGVRAREIARTGYAADAVHGQWLALLDSVVAPTVSGT
jgi:glycosyltransferase involved in cell wall biosynthesis